MFVPAAFPSGDAPGRWPTSAAPAGDAGAADVPPAVLLVDDHPANLVALAAVLEPLDARLVRAGSGAEAVALAARETFAAVVLDVQMPGVDGFAVARAIRARDAARGAGAAPTPIVFLTAGDAADRANTAAAYALGAVDYLGKPFDADALRAKVGALAGLAQARHRALRQRDAAAAARLAAVFETLPDAVAVFDRDWRWTYANPAARATLAALGRDPDAVAGRTLWDACPAVAGTRAEAALRDAERAGRPATFEEYVPALGTWVEARVVPGPDGVVALVRDVGERHRAEAALRDSEARYRFLADAVPVMVWTADADGKLDYVSALGADYTGRGGEASLGDGWAAALHPDDADRARATWGRSVATGEPYEIEFRIWSAAHAAYRWHLGRARPRRGGDGRVAGWVGTNTDIHEQRRAGDRTRRLQEVTAALAAPLVPAEAARVVVEQALAALGAQAGVVVLAADPAPGDPPGGALEMVHGLGYEPGVLARWRRFPLAADAPLAEAARTGAVVAVATPGERAARYPALAASERVYASSASVPLTLGAPGAADARTLGALGLSFAAEGAVGGDDAEFLLALGRQCAQALERARLYAAERAARAEADAMRARLTQVFEQAPVAVAVARGRVAADLVFELANPHYLELVPPGRPVVGRALREVLPEVDAAVLAVLQQVLDAGEAFTATEFRVPLDRDGDGRTEDYFFNLVYHPLLEADGRASGLVTVATEVTPQVRGRHEAERLQRAAEQARAAAEAARERATEANAAKGQFLATMSHELRTPLNAIQGHVQLLEMGLHGPVTDDQRAALGRVQVAQRHLLGLINDVLNYARLESGRVEYALAPVDVREVLADVLAMVEPQLAAKALALDAAPAAGAAPAVARADREKLAQVLLNLFGNAAKFTPAGGRVAVDAAADGGLVRVRVADTGVGIPADKLDAVFEPFVQVRAGYLPAEGGTGLGLAISRDLARGMGGDLTAESRLGEGSAFTLTLPRA